MRDLSDEKTISVLKDLSHTLLGSLNKTYPCDTERCRGERTSYILAIILIKKKIKDIKDQHGL